MATDNLVLGFGRGKVGDLVFYRREGQQITRARNRAPKDPKTDKQLAQRCRISGPMMMYRSMRKTLPLIGLWEYKKDHQTDYNNAVQLNMYSFTDFSTKQMAGANNVNWGNYYISQGSLKQLVLYDTTDNWLLAPLQLTLADLSTIATLSAALIASANYAAGDELHFIQHYSLSIDNTYDAQAYRTLTTHVPDYWHEVKIVLNTTDTTTLESLHIETRQGTTGAEFGYARFTGTSLAVQYGLVCRRKTTYGYNVSTCQLCRSTAAGNIYQQCYGDTAKAQSIASYK